MIEITTPEQKWIASNASDDAIWHLASRKEVKSEKTGKVFATYLVTRCTGRTVGKSYGHSTRTEAPGEFDRTCARCERAARGTP